MASGKAWTREELLIAMNLYCKLPFGQLRHGNPLVFEVAQKMGRTPSSLSMKLCNLASFDPHHLARGVKGLRSSSKADRDIWQEFSNDWERLAVESEEKFQQLLEREPEGNETLLLTGIKSHLAKKLTLPTGPTECVMTTKGRIGQSFFRQAVLSSYNCQCCITGNPIPELLVASHIAPWSAYPSHRVDPSNGICLAQTQDAAFDRGLITFDDDYRLIVGPYLREFLPSESLERNFLAFEGKQIRMPDKFLPAVDFIRIHRDVVFFAFN